MVLNIFPRRKEPAAVAVVEPEAIALPEPSPEALEDNVKRPTRRGTRGGRGRKRPGADGTPESDESAESEEAVAEAPKPVRARRTRAAAAVAAPVDDTDAPESEAVEPVARAPRTRTPRTRPVDAPTTVAVAASPLDTASILRAIEQQGRQIEQLVRAQDESGRRGPVGASGGTVAANPARVGIFVDAANIELACDRLRARFDWSKIMAMLTRDRQLIRAISYAPVHEDTNVSLETQRFAEPFLGRGYKVVTKPLKRFQDGSVKANVDIEIAIDVLEMLDRLDVVCLVSGDGDFQYLVEAVQRKGVRVEVVAVGSSTATNLRNAADRYIDLQQILAQVRV